MKRSDTLCREKMEVAAACAARAACETVKVGGARILDVIGCNEPLLLLLLRLRLRWLCSDALVEMSRRLCGWQLVIVDSG